MSNIMTAKQIAERCNVREGTIISFIKFCKETGYAEIPNPIPYEKSKYTYNREDAATIIRLFVDKPRGVMADYNYKHNWGATYRSKYKKVD